MASGAPSTAANTVASPVEGWLSDTGSSDNVVATAFVDCVAFYRETAPVELESVGQTEFADGAAASHADAVPDLPARRERCT